MWKQLRTLVFAVCVAGLGCLGLPSETTGAALPTAAGATVSTPNPASVSIESSVISGLSRVGSEADTQGIASVTQGAHPLSVVGAELAEAQCLVLHYNRPDGDYDGWGLHAFGDIEGTVEWANPIPFTGEDSYGRFAWVKVKPGSSNVGFIVHKGDQKDPDGDRFANPQ